MNDLKHMFDPGRETLIMVWDWGNVFGPGLSVGGVMLLPLRARYLVLTNARILALGYVNVATGCDFVMIELEDIENIDDSECAKKSVIKLKGIQLECRDHTRISLSGPRNLPEVASILKTAWHNHIPLIRLPHEEQMLYKATCGFLMGSRLWIPLEKGPFEGFSSTKLMLTDHRLLFYGIRIVEKEETSQRGRVIRKVVHFSGPCLKLMSIPLSDVVKVRTNFRLAKKDSKMELVLENKPCELTLSSFTIPPYTDSAFAQEQCVLTNSASMKQAGKELTLELVVTPSATRTILSLLYQAIPSTVEISDSPHVTIPQILQIKQCPDCGKMVASEATTCRYCEHPFPPSEVAAAKQQSQAAIQALELQSREKSRKTWGRVLTVLGGLLFFIGSLALIIPIAQLSAPSSSSDKLTGFVVTLFMCPLPLLVAGSLLLGRGIYLLLGTRKAASSGVLLKAK